LSGRYLIFKPILAYKILFLKIDKFEIFTRVNEQKEGKEKREID